MNQNVLNYKLIHESCFSIRTCFVKKNKLYKLILNRGTVQLIAVERLIEELNIIISITNLWKLALHESFARCQSVSSQSNSLDEVKCLQDQTASKQGTIQQLLV